MNTKIAIVLTFVFGSFIISPTIISIVEKNFDVSILFNINEEENNQKETSKTFDLKLSDSNTALSLFNAFSKSNLLGFYSKKYASISQENNSPPPEFF